MAPMSSDISLLTILDPRQCPPGSSHRTRLLAQALLYRLSRIVRLGFIPPRSRPRHPCRSRRARRPLQPDHAGPSRRQDERQDGHASSHGGLRGEPREGKNTREGLPARTASERVDDVGVGREVGGVGEIDYLESFIDFLWMMCASTPRRSLMFGNRGWSYRS